MGQAHAAPVGRRYRLESSDNVRTHLRAADGLRGAAGQRRARISKIPESSKTVRNLKSVHQQNASAALAAVEPDYPGETLATRAGRLIREEIISGRLKPGAPLRFDTLRSTYGVSVTPLREALALLVAERLVHQEDQRGFRVAGMSAEELDDITERRLDMELAALERAVASGDDEWEIQVLAAQRRLQLVSERVLAQRRGLDEEWELRHRELHIALISACGSPWLLRFCGQLYDHFDRYRRVAGSQPRTTKAIVEIGEDPIVEAGLQRKPLVARELLGRHITRTADEIRRILFASPVRRRQAKGAG